MSNASLPALPTRRAVFEPLVALAKARTVALVESDVLDREDGEFLLRALFDLESDGIELFGASVAADPAFYTAVADYLAARVGNLAADAHVLAPESAEAAAALATAEGERVAELLVLPGAAPCGRQLDRAVTELVSHQRRQSVKHKFLVHNRGDHVGVAVVDIDPGDAQGIFVDDDSTVEIYVRERVPLGHKVALVALEPDAEVIEYGVPIGKATAPLEAGTYVHTHNLRSARW